MKHIIAITGGIGSGKSYVCRLLETQFGIPVYDCDSQAKRLNETSDTIRQQLKQLVGPEVYDTNGQLQRQILASFLFDNAANAERVNGIIHPVVADHFKAWASQQNQDIVAMECAILFESGFDHLADYTIAVSAPQQLCIERAMQRDTASEEAIRKRIALQMPDQERRQRADFVIENDGSNLTSQITKILETITTI